MIVASIRIAVLDLSELELTNGARLAVGMSQSTTWVRDPAIHEKFRGQRGWTIVVDCRGSATDEFRRVWPS